MVASLDVLVEGVGGCGRFQVLLLLLVFAPVALAVWSMLHMVFGAVEPAWWCAASAVPWNESQGLAADGQKLFETYFRGADQLNSSELTGTMDLRNCTFGSGQDCDVIVFASGMRTVVSEFQLVCALSWVPPMTISVQMVGVLVGATVAGQVGDSFGRKKSLFVMTGLHSAFCVVAAFSSSWIMFTAVRILIGFSIGGIISTGYSYPAEFLAVRWRALIGAAPVWGVGAVTFSLVVWALRDWRHIHLATGVCTAATLPAWFFVPESVRWLVTKGRMQGAHEVLRKIARFNGRHAPEIQALESFQTSDVSQVYTYTHLFSSWRMAKVSLLSGLVWVFCSLTYYGMSFGVKNLSGDFYLNLLLLAAVEILPNLFVLHLLNRLGRRWTCAGTFMLAATAVVILIPVSLTVSEPQAGVAVSALSIFARTAVIFGWNAVTVHHAELFPTVVRNIGMGYLNTVARIGGILAPYLLSQDNGHGFGFYIIIVVAMVMNTAATLLLRETGGQPLQEFLSEMKKADVKPETAIAVESQRDPKGNTGFESEKNKE